MSNAAYNKKVRVSSDNGVNWFELPATSPSMDVGGDILDDTNMATNAGYRSRCYGLHDWSLSADSNLKVPASPADAPADALSGATALGIVRDGKLNRQDILVQYLPTGNTDGTGLQGKAVVESYNYAGDVGGLETVSISIQANGALTAV